MTFAQQQRSAQQQELSPGSESEKIGQPKADDLKAQGSGKLCNKVALITGGDSSIGRAVAIAFAKEGADVAIVYRNESQEAKTTKQMVEQQGRSCLAISGDVGDEEFCQQAVQQTIDQLGKLDVLVNNAVEQDSSEDVKDISTQQLESNLQTNLCPMFYMTNAALPYLCEGSTIINTTSVTVGKGNEQLPDSSANRGAIMTFTRSLSQSLEDKGIRVNGVAPGPVWTLLVPSTATAEKVEEFGKQVPTGDNLPEEIAPSFVFLASDEASYMAGQIVFTRSMF
ncbi:MAG TPA: NAD(P)-dependent oxidoreductase [Cyanobacteria bacterium UBA8553]|nr:NAD(P)-dependent oxidoreductase [Cyanobacteria bacterium UBA8553]